MSFLDFFTTFNRRITHVFFEQSNDLNIKTIDEIKNAISTRNAKALNDFLETVPSIDVAETLEEINDIPFKNKGLIFNNNITCTDLYNLNITNSKENR